MANININKSDANIKAGLEKAVDILTVSGTGVSLTASKAVAVDSSGQLKTVATTDTELGYLSGTTSPVQNQLNDKANVDNAIFTGTMTVGSESPDPHYPDAKFVAINGDSGHSYSGKLGVTGEAVSDADQTSCGVGGNAKTYGANKARGVVGVGKVSATGDTGIAVGVEGRSTDTHAGANNVAFQADAQNGAVNYSFEGLNGLMINKDSITSGDGINSTVIDSVTGLKFNGTATNWRDLYPTQFIPSPTNGATTSAYNGNLAGYELTKNATKAVQAMFQINHDYKEGSDIKPHMHIYTPSATGTKLKVTIEYTWTNIDSTGAITPTETPILITGITASTVKNNLIIPLGTLSGSGKTISSILTIRVRRDTNDADSDIDSSIWLKSIDVHYEIDTVGSRTDSAK